MKKIVFILIICFSQINCNLRTNDNYTKRVVLSKFDVNKLKNIKVDDSIKFTKNDTVYTIFEYDDTYGESRQKVDEQLVQNFQFNKKTLLLKEKSTTFSFIIIGIYQEYDTNGIVIKEVNHDENFPFSLTDLIKMLKNKFNINVDGPKPDADVNRGMSEDYGKNVYTVSQLLPLGDGERHLIIDGENGKFLEETKSFFIE